VGQNGGQTVHLLNMLLTIVAIGVLIGVHEFGHFIVAKMIGVRVEIFSLGFWKRLASWKVGGTEYRICVIPLGGYVKLAGEERPGPGTQPEPWEFYAKPPLKRIAVFVSGALMNAVMGVALFVIAFKVGVWFTVPEIGDTQPGTPAWAAGLDHGDEIVAINGRKDPDFEDLVRASALTDSDDTVRLVIRSGSGTSSYEISPEYDPDLGLSRLGILPRFSTRISSIMRIETAGDEVSPAEKAGLEAGDILLELDDRPVTDSWEAVRIIRRFAGRDLKVRFKRDGETRTVTVRPIAQPRRVLGVSCVQTVVDEVAHGGDAWALGLRAGDTITHVNGQPVGSIVTVRELLENHVPAEQVLSVLREGHSLQMRRSFGDAWAIADFLDSFTCKSDNVLTWVKPGSPAHAAGLRVGDRIVSVAGKSVSSWEEFLRANGERRDKERTIKVVRGEESLALKATPAIDPDPTHGLIGVSFSEPMRRLRRYGVFKSVREGIYKGVGSLRDLLLTLRGFATRRVSTRQMGGIIMIAVSSYHAAETGLGRLFYMTAIISIGLAFLNLLPIPVLDGGHVLFTLIEMARGRPVNEKIVAVAQYIGLGVLLALVIYVTRNDIMRFWPL
jgi:regulator of sigma E protease